MDQVVPIDRNARRARGVLAELQRLQDAGVLDGLVYVANIKGHGQRFGVIGRYEIDVFPALAALRRLRTALEPLADGQEEHRTLAHG